MICTFEKTIYENAATGYCVAAFKTDDDSVPSDARSKYISRDRKIHFTGVGYSIPATDAINLELDGKWQKTKYGVNVTLASRDKSLDQLIKYLEMVRPEQQIDITLPVIELPAKAITDDQWNKLAEMEEQNNGIQQRSQK